MEAAASLGVFGPIAAPSTYEETIARLGVAIRIGLLAPGVRLPAERDLARQLGISRSTLRQALAVLTQTGHLKALRGRSGGTFVAAEPPVASAQPYPLEQLGALLDWRMAIELATVELAAERAASAERERLDEAARMLDEDSVLADWGTFRRADAAFHLRVAEAARSPRLMLAMTRLHGELSDLFHSVDPLPGLREACRADHGEVAGAVGRGDAAAARAAMARHLAATKRAIDALGAPNL